MDEKVRKLNQSELPSFLKSREGWGKLFEMKRSPYPHLHQIEPTNVCPYHCIMCPRGNEMTRKTGHMDFAVFSKVIEEVATYPDEIKRKEIELFHFGESLIHPLIAEMNEYASSKGLKTLLSVNAIELNQEIAHKLISGKAGKIIVSLDGFDAKSFQEIRGRKIDYDQAIENIVQADSLIKSMKATTRLTVRMIALNQNMHMTEFFKDFWSSKNIEVEIRPFFPWGEKEMVKLGVYEKYPPFMPCPFAWQYLVVQWNGDVVACCRDYNAENLMGNVKDETLLQIWNGEKYAKFRSSMIAGEYGNSICGPCMALYYTEES
ncbi:MAG: SPASM domain-containing protein [Bacteroidota bacterium]